VTALASACVNSGHSNRGSTVSAAREPHHRTATRHSGDEQLLPLIRGWRRGAGDGVGGGPDRRGARFASPRGAGRPQSTAERADRRRGLIGLATAAACRRAGLGSVVVVERAAQLASAASGGNGGGIAPDMHALTDSPEFVTLGRASLALYRRLNAESGGAMGLRTTRWLQLFPAASEPPARSPRRGRRSRRRWRQACTGSSREPATRRSPTAGAAFDPSSAAGARSSTNSPADERPAQRRALHHRCPHGRGHRPGPCLPDPDRHPPTRDSKLRPTGHLEVPKSSRRRPGHQAESTSPR
jgi:FAD dependent oxidoreductase